MRAYVAALSIALAAALGACSGQTPASQTAKDGPSGQLRVTLNGGSTLATIAVQNVFDPSQVFLIDCMQKPHLLDGGVFCDELTVLPPGVYEIIVQSQDPTCHTAQDHYKVVVTENQTTEVTINLICGQANGGLDVIVTQRERPVITGITFSFDQTGQTANKFICQEVPGENGDVRVEVQVTDSDTACENLTPTWTAVDANGNDVTATLLSGFQQVPGDPCRFSALIDAGAAQGTYNITFTVSDGTQPPTSITFPIHIIDCGPVLVHENIGNATASLDGGGTVDATPDGGDPAFFSYRGTIAEPDGGTGSVGVQALPPCTVRPADAGTTLYSRPSLGNLDQYLFFFANGSQDANWQGASKGFIGDVAVDGLQASERTSGFVPYAGTIYTNAPTLGAWQDIINENPAQATAAYDRVTRISGLETDLNAAFATINGMTATPGFTSVSPTSLDCLNTQNGVTETYVINITSGFQVSSKINIYGDATDTFVLRWDTDANPANGYQGIVKFQSGGAIVPGGALKASNFINVAGDINSSGGGTNPPPPYPQGPRYNDGQGPLIIGGQDFNGGGFFTGYWLTTGDPVSGDTQPLSNGIFVGGWYTLTDKFSMTSGTSGVYVSPPVIAAPAIRVVKYVSPDSGENYYDANTPPGPQVASPTSPEFKYEVTNIGDVILTNVTLVDNKLGPITLSTTTLAPGQTTVAFATGSWAAGQQNNLATVVGTPPSGPNVTDDDPANWFGVLGQIQVVKEVSGDGINWFDANTPPGIFLSTGTNPQFRYTVTNVGTDTLTGVTLTDNVLGPQTVPPSGLTLSPGESFQVTATGTWTAGQNINTATTTGIDSNGNTVSDTDVANYFGGAETASLTIEKQVSVDNGLTWQDADTPPGPFLLPGVVPQFRYVVTNTGAVTLYNIVVTDSEFGTIGTIPVLTPGDQASLIHVGL